MAAGGDEARRGDAGFDEAANDARERAETGRGEGEGGGGGEVIGARG
jgi:hypothetical protein